MAKLRLRRDRAYLQIQPTVKAIMMDVFDATPARLAFFSPRRFPILVIWKVTASVSHIRREKKGQPNRCCHTQSKWSLVSRRCRNEKYRLSCECCRAKSNEKIFVSIGEGGGGAGAVENSHWDAARANSSQAHHSEAVWPVYKDLKWVAHLAERSAYQLHWVPNEPECPILRTYDRKADTMRS